MDTTLAMTSLKTDLLARAILARLQDATPGHCARVDFLTQDEAGEVCERMQMDADSSVLIARVLSHRADSDSGVFISADKAIEIRNRKDHALCLFVPTDLVDAAVSSLANSFEVIDARDLYKSALQQLLERLDADAAKRVRSTLARIRTMPQVDDAQRLDFAAALAERQKAHDLDHAGLELWRVGLIADGGADFVTRLDKNRECARKLTRPSKLQAMPAERIDATGVDATTASKLREFFRTRPMNDIASWSRTLEQQDELAFHRWQFIQEERSDLREVVVRPFMDTSGKVERWCKLKQHGGEGALLAEYGEKCSIVVRWSTQPLDPRNLRGWRIEIAPAGGDEDDVVADLPMREVPASRREATLKLDLNIESDEPIDYAVCVRVTPLDAAKNDIRDLETGHSLAAKSDEFYLVPQVDAPPPPHQTRRGEPNIPFGRLSYLLSTTESELVEGEPQWVSASDGAFRLKLNSKHEVRIEVSSLLLELERRLIKDPKGVWSFVARAIDVEPFTEQQIEALTAPEFDSEAWQGFWTARAAFFGKVAKSHPRDTLEVADWTSDLAGSALRYARAYGRLLGDLTSSSAPREELAAALGVDSLLIEVDTGHGCEESLITLPTHPMRAAWLASYSQLLREWEKRIIERGSSSRRSACDLDLVRLVTPANTPAFFAHPMTDSAFVFFQDLQFFYGVALPAQVPEPQRRLDDIAVQLGVDVSHAAEDGSSVARLAHYVERFLDTHPYTNALTMTAINPDRGELLAEALQRYFDHKIADIGDDDDGGGDPQLPRLDVTGYAERPERGALQALEAVGRSQALHLTSGVDERHPALAVTVRDRSSLRISPPEDAHLALVSDLTRPAIRAVQTIPSVQTQPGATDGASFSLYGLITRLVSSLSLTGAQVVCRYTISANSTGKGQQHPVTSFTDALADIQATQLTACAVALGGTANQMPALEVTLDSEQQRLLAQLHQRTNWVVTSDRHFALEYYDSPLTPQLAEQAETYVLDYVPEFTEGMGRRMMATTSWRDEVTIVLRRAMEDLGLRAVESSVRQALQTLKTVSGGLALQTLFSSSSAAAAAGLAIVTALLKSQGRLRQAILLPVDLHPGLFTLSGATNTRGERRCDLVLIGLRRGIVEATCIEVKWRRGNAPLDDLIPDMLNQMEGTALAMHTRFFDDASAKRVDGALQRAHLANTLRFYLERASRYGLLAADAQSQFRDYLSRLEKSGLDFRFAYEGYIVNLDGEPHKPIPVPDGKIIILTGSDLDTTPEFCQSSSWPDQQEREQGTASEASPLADAQTEEVAHEESAGSADDADHGEDSTVPALPHAAVSEPVDALEEPLATPKSPDTAHHEQLAVEAMGAGDEAPTQVTVALGEAHGEIVRWEPSVKGSPHLFIAGIPGQGKSWTTLRLLTELGRQGVPALVLDFHGQFAEDNNVYSRTVRPTILDAAHGLPFSPFDLSSGAEAVSWRAASYELAEIFGYVAGLGEIQQDALRLAIRDAYVAHGFDQPDDDEELLPPTLADVLRNLERLESSRRTANVLARCRPLLEMELFRPQPDTPDLITLARAGLVIDLRHLYAESVQLAAGAFVLRKVYRDMFHWGGADRLRLAIVLDEAHRLAKDVTLPKVMKEGRKFGVSVIVASQGMADFHSDILGNAGAKVIFRTNYPDSRKIAGFIRTRPGFDLAQRIEQLPVGYAFVQTPEMPYGTMVGMFAPDAGQR